MQSSGLTAATLWDPDGALTLLPGTPPSRVTTPHDPTRLVGLSTCAGQSWITRWHLDSRDVECVAPAPTRTSNNLGEPASFGLDGDGRVGTSVQGRVLVYETDGTVLDLGPGFFGAVNADGVAAISRGDPVIRGTIVWRGSLADGFTELPNPTFASTGGPWSFCFAWDINAEGTIVGSCSQSQNFATAGLWLPDGRAFDLRDIAPFPPGSAEVFATDVDDRGLILAPTWNPGSTGFFIRPAVLLTPLPELAEGECGGEVPCQCGDTVVADYAFPADLTCSVTGTEAALVVASNVQVDGAGHTLLGTGDGTGVLWDQAGDSRLKNLVVDGFLAGFKLRSGARGNTLQNVTARNSTLAMFFENSPENKVTSSRLQGDVLLRGSHDNRSLGTCISGEVVEEDSTGNVFKLVPCDPGRKKVASR
jgi:hypothetical protein